MTIIKIYDLRAKSGAGDDLLAELRDLAILMEDIAGNEGVEIIRNVVDPDDFLFLERWASEDARDAGGKAVGKGAFGAIIALLAEPPVATAAEACPIHPA